MDLVELQSRGVLDKPECTCRASLVFFCRRLGWGWGVDGVHRALLLLAAVEGCFWRGRGGAAEQQAGVMLMNPGTVGQA